jgi:glutamate racemase
LRSLSAMDDRPIGVFDSGFGGLTVVRALLDLLPDEQLVYLGDTARYPYGPRPPEEVRRFSAEIAGYLTRVEDVKMLVVACNTAASAALDLLRFNLDVPVVGVIEPGLRAAAQATESGRVAVIGTVGTVASGAYQRAARPAPASSSSSSAARPTPTRCTCSPSACWHRFAPTGSTCCCSAAPTTPSWPGRSAT